MNAWECPLLLGQMAAEAELTVGAVLAGCCVLAALVGSISVLALWWTRVKRKAPLVPAARRPLVRIPVALLALGLLIALFMSTAAINASFGEEAADLDVEQLVVTLQRTVGFDLGLIAVLGGPVLLLRLWRQFILVPDSRVVAADQVADDLPVDVRMLPEADDANPYAAPAVDAGVLPGVESSLPVASAAEPWIFGRELWVATEVCLAAWLPTALLRVTLLVLLQDDSQHPFLDLIQNGVGIDILLLIAVTAVILAPVMEELLYRVVILGGLLGRSAPTLSSTVVAIGVSSMLFAFAHGFPDSVALLPLAVAISWTYHQRRSYRTVVLVHFLFNGFNIVVAGLGML